jgi:hypothetical protein
MQLKTTDEIPQNHCYNCNTILEEKAKYCSNCGQKHTTGKIPVYEFVYDFLKNVFNIDAKLPKTILYLLVLPGRLTNEFFKGKHKSYLKPAQVFVFVTLLCFTLITFQTNTLNNNFSLKEEQETFKLNINYNQGENDYYYLKGIDTTKYIVDSLLKNVKQNISLEANKTIIDTTFQAFLQSDSSKKDSLFIPLIFDKERTHLKVSEEDIITLSEKELCEKYIINSLIPKVMFVQTIKSIKNEKAIVNYFLGRLSWTFFLLVPLFALILKLVYIRRKQFYVEHLVFTLHFHAFAFSILSLLILFENIFPAKLKTGFLCYILIYLFISMKLYYKQGFFKTLLKYFLLMMSYIIVFIFTAIITTMIIFVLF